MSQKCFIISFKIEKKGDYMKEPEKQIQISFPNKDEFPSKEKEITFEEEGIDAKALVTRTDRRGVVTFASKAYRDMTKFSKEELVGKPHSVVRHPFMPKVVFRDMWKTIMEKKHWSGILVNQRKDGKHYWVRVDVDAIDADGNIISDMKSIGEEKREENKFKKIEGFVAVRREPTQKEIEEAKKLYVKIRQKKEF
jgi:aerotaxis receptor